MAITNFQAIANSYWNTISSQYTAITPVTTKSGTTDPYLTAYWYVKSNDNTSFALALMSSGLESILLSTSTTADQLDLACTVSPGNQGFIFHTFNESQGWSDNFNVALDITNTNSAKGKWTFTKGKGGNRPK